MSEQLNESFGVDHLDDLEPQLMAFLSFLEGPSELNPRERCEVIHLVNLLEACKAKQTYAEVQTEAGDRNASRYQQRQPTYSHPHIASSG